MENKLKIGTYVRTNGGHIGKIVDYTLQYEIKVVNDLIVDEPHEAYLLNTRYNFDDEDDVLLPEDVKSYGDRLIDVIEGDDLVNGRFVVNIDKDMIELLTDTDMGICVTNDEIISVVCREILERNGYSEG